MTWKILEGRLSCNHGAVALAAIAASIGFANGAAAQCDCLPTTNLDPPPGVVLLDATSPLALPERYSLRSDGAQILPVAGERNNSHPDVSANVELIAWVTSAMTVVVGRENPVPLSQIYLSEIDDGKVSLVSRIHPTLPNAGHPASGNSDFPIAQDDRLVFFQSSAPNLIPGDTNMTNDIFVYDRQAQLMKRLSQRVDNGAEGNGGSTGADVSDDGRYAVFTSQANNLSSHTGPVHPYSDCPTFQPTNAVTKVYVLDRGVTHGAGPPALAEQWMTLITVGRDANGNCTNPSGASDQATISANGCRVAFRSSASNLIAGQTIPGSHVYVWERSTSQIRLVSHAFGNPTVPANRPAASCEISDDGRYVVFLSDANNLVGPTPEPAPFDTDVFVVDLEADPSTEPVAVRINYTPSGNYEESGGRFRGPGISPNGRWVVLSSANPAFNTLNGQVSPNLVELLIHDRDASGDGVFDEVGDVVTKFALLEDPAIGQGLFADGLGAPPVQFSGIVTLSGGAQAQFLAIDTEAENLVAGQTPVDDNADDCTMCGRDIYLRRLW